MIEIVTTVLFAWLFAEVSGGLFHWWEDRYGNPEWAWSDNKIVEFIGDNIVVPNLEHHQHPGRLCQKSYWNRNNTTMVPCLIGAAAFFWCLPVCLGFILLSQMNEFHSWSHQKCNPVIRFFQKIGVLQSPKHHKIHHTRPFDKHYCVMTNYVNPVLKALRFWDGLEWIVWKLFGAKPLVQREMY